MIWNKFLSYSFHLFILAASINSESALVNVNECGDLSIQEPAILGRNVTFTFTPSFYDETAIILWQRTNKVNAWSTLQRKPKFDQFVKNRKYYFIVTGTVSTDTKNDGVYYRIQYSNDSVKCTMETPKLELKSISSKPCGYVHLRTKKIEFGKKVMIEYFPTKRVIDNPNSYVRVWVRSDGKETKRLLHEKPDDVYKETMMTNDKYVLSISSFNANLNGRYGVTCQTSAGTYSDFVEVILPVAPSSPVFEKLQDIDECKKCIVSEADVPLEVVCKISGGTEPITVTMAIGNDTLNVTRHDFNFFYKTTVNIRNNHHTTLMKCSVLNDALKFPLTVTVPVYVIKSPIFQGFDVPSVLREGGSVNITCEFASGRPTPTLSLKISGMELSPVQQSHTSNTTDQSYSSVISLTTFERNWTDQYISCCRYSNWYKPKNNCVVLGRVNYLFPPSDLKLQIITREKPTRVYAVCTIYNSSPACQAKWQAPDGSIQLERNNKNTSRPSGAWDSVYRVTVNTSQNYTGKQITCLSDCPDFNVSVKKTESLPYKPTIQFNLSSSVLEIFKGDQANVKCTARSIPKSDIFWVDPRTSDEEPIILRECLHETDCVISIRGDNITQRILFCSTIHLLESNSRKLTIHIIEKWSKHAKDQEGIAGAGYFIYLVLLASIVGTAIVIIIVVLITRKKINDANVTSAAKRLSGEDTVRHRCNDEPEEPVRRYMRDVSKASGQPKSKHNGATMEAIDETPGDDKDVMEASGQPKPEHNEGTTEAIDATPSDDALYSEVNKAKKLDAIVSTSQPNKPTEGKELVYADLALELPGSKHLQGAVGKGRDSPTEYESIDFVKTAEGRKQGNDANKTDNTDNIYANQ